MIWQLLLLVILLAIAAGATLVLWLVERAGSAGEGGGAPSRQDPH